MTQYKEVSPIKAEDLNLFFSKLGVASEDFLKLNMKEEHLTEDALNQLMNILENIRISSDNLQMRILAKKGFS